HVSPLCRATPTLQHVLYADPSFTHANEVHLRLGLIHKVCGEFKAAYKRFQLVLNDSTECTLSRHEILFHIAHLHEVVGRPRAARQRYEALLQEEDLSASLKDHIHRQLGWLFHSVEAFGEKARREEQAVTHLKRALEFAPKSSRTLYLLGRCYSSIGKVHEAFQAYKQSVVCSEANADTWCSIGVLYQQHSQYMDAQQAYISAVQLDKTHKAAWTNLGLLYESVSHPKDALACYINASEDDPKLQPRIKFLQQQLANAPQPAVNSRPCRLPPIEEAWNKNTSSEMNRETQKLQPAAQAAKLAQQQQQQRGFPTPGMSPPPYPGAQTGNAAKRFKPGEPVEAAGVPAALAAQRRTPPQYYLSHQQLQLLQYLQSQSQLSPQQQSQLNQLQHQYRMMQQHQQQMRLQQQQQQASPRFPQQAGQPPVAYPPQQQQPQQQQPAPPPPPPAQTAGFSSFPSNGGSSAIAGSDVASMSERELAQLLTQKDLAASLAEDLIKQFAQTGDLGLEALAGGDTKPLLDGLESTPATEPQRPAEPAAPAAPTGEPQPDASRTKPRPSALTRADLKVKVEPARTQPSFHIDMTAAEVAEACVGLGQSGVGNLSILEEDAAPPAPAVPPRTVLRRDQLLQQTPSVFVENKKEAFSPQMQEFCLKNPIAVIRGMAAALKLDLGLFSTKTLVEAHPEHAVEIRTQVCQSSDENWDPTFTKKVWGCMSSRSHLTTAKYAHYQAATFTDSLREEQESKTTAAAHRDSDSDSRDSFSKYQRLGKKRGHKTIKFGTNVDLSDEKKWRPQLLELMKLPAFCRVVSAGNMLSHVGHPILGMNTVQLYMKVPGSRTPGHQENNNFCSININIGPGDCEWFGVPDAYWGVINNLCEKNGISYLHGSWWPDMDELLDHGVPVYRFMQRPGDLVWVNTGCVHWVQASGWCNNIAWNVGPLTARQHRLAVERYEWNKLQRFKSIVPMQHLSWNLARNIRVSDPKLHRSIKTVLLKGLKQVMMMIEFTKACNVDIRFHGRGKNESTHYCGVCEMEVFNLLFIKEHEKRHVVHCVDCARRHAPRLAGFICLEEYKLQELQDVYDNFQLHVPPMAPPA
ncbi:lysine-specific demethylase 6A-like, partial [Amphibalanus amphitrite]|uniref:lysine-specific demethylase 6A-like n=1 Tax=Amphibalanus amphitrite TaxID=1232801 RepID=UPI001C91194E